MRRSSVKLLPAADGGALVLASGFPFTFQTGVSKRDEYRSGIFNPEIAS